jgi:hypothetical protein
MVALGLQCSCKIQCSDHWNKQALQQACHSYALLTKLKQLQRVYDILLGVRNIFTQEITLTVAGKQLFHKYKQHFCFRLSSMPGGLHSLSQNFYLPVLYCSPARR